MALKLETIRDVEQALRMMGNGYPNDLTKMADIIAQYLDEEVVDESAS